ncbi:hypothetical protein [Pseudooceanicola sp. 200-1SW]|uniref:hypothetical protein n=1 Tax=Pseudooceanicola sp. 200-1SW TaxID=3425949 RepID=UPI003D7F9EAE
MRAALLSVPILALATQASALSCLPPDAVASYLRADQAAETYVVLLGDFRFDAPSLPEPDLSNPTPEEHRFPARFEGQALGPEGFTGSYALEMEVTLTCAGPWCAGVPADGAGLAFVEMTETGYDLRLGPCGGQYFATPDPAVTDRIAACHAGDEACGAE